MINNVDSKAIVGSCKKVKNVFVDDVEKLLPIVPIAIRITGNKAIKKLFDADGKGCSFLVTIIASSFLPFNLIIILGKIIPAQTATGKLSISPYSKVLPTSALKTVVNVMGPG